MKHPHRRLYRTGMGFCLWRYTEVRQDGILYLRRLHIIQIPRVGSIMLHWIERPDHVGWLHNHPVAFFSILLRGTYSELRANDGQKLPIVNHVIRANWMPLRARHRIFNVDHGGVLSLVFAGPKRREWGYFTHSRFINWKEFSL